MQGKSRQPFGPAAVLDRLRLRRAARRYAAHAWPVVPGAVRVTRWWRDRPHTVLLATGRRFDALEVPAALGLRVLGTARLHTGLDLPDLRGPVAAVPDGSWFFLVRPGAPLRSDLDASPDIVRHGRGSWIPAPPSRTPDGPIRWVVSPESVDWRLPGALAVQSTLLDALARKMPAPRFTVPRQMSTSRRAA